MLVKLLFAALIVVILGTLASGLFFLVNDSSDSHRTVKALTWRIGLSIAAFILLLIAGWAGLIEPNAVHHG